MTEDKDESKSGRPPIIPLWIIALFVSLTETVLGIAVVQTTAGIQIVLTAFVVIFPLLIAGAFFAVLWHKPYVFYPPNEFGRKTDVASYVKAMQQKTIIDEPQLYTNIQETIRKTLVSDNVINELASTLSPKMNKPEKEQIAQILNSATDTALNDIRGMNFLSVDTRPIQGKIDGKVYNLIYKENYPVWSFLTEIYFKLREDLEPYTYGTKWVLRDTATKNNLIYFGTNQKISLTNEQNYSKYVELLQSITLTNGGIKSGMSLEVIWL